MWTRIKCVSEALCHRVCGIVHACQTEGGGVGVCVCVCVGGGMRVRRLKGNMRMALTLLDFLFWFGDIHNTTWTYGSRVYADT